jgi:hypothetical protein
MTIKMYLYIGFPRDVKKELMALLLAHGSSENKTMDTILEHSTALAKEARCTEEKFLQGIAVMFKEAENAIPDAKW